jgi:regulatory protein
MRITSIEHIPRKRRYEVRIDHVLVVPMSPEVLAQAQLRAGQEISEERLKTLEQTEARHSALAGALRLLSYRQRSEKEMRDALQRRGVKGELLAETMARLQQLRLLDDADFARTYVDQRDRTAPRGRRLLAAELKARGVGKTAIEEPLADVDETDAAYRAAAKRAQTLVRLPYADFQRRLGDHLLRRGFGYETSRATVRRLWAELGEEEARDEAPLDF